MALDPDMRWEAIGDDVVVLDAAKGVVHRLTGDVASVALHLLRGEPVPASLDHALDALEEAGLYRAPVGASRRRFVQGAVGLAVGITTLALPRAAAAASGSGTVDVVYTGGTYTDGDVTIAREPTVTRTTNINASWQTATLTYTDGLGISRGPYTIEKQVNGISVAPEPPATKLIERMTNSSINVYLANSQRFTVTIVFQTKTTVYNVPPL